jgi:hypothetical protein
MIRINLLKGVERKKRPAPLRIPGSVIKGAIVFLLVAILAGAGYLLITSGILKKKPVIVHAEVEHTPPQPIAGSNVVEDVVHEIQGSRDVQEKGGVLHLSYADLSFAEKINYEILFAKNVCDLLARSAPAAIGLKTLEAREFQSIYGVGVSPSQGVITDFFNTLREKEQAELLPRPHTNIMQRGKGYQFVFTMKKEFGLNLLSPVVNLSLRQLPNRDNLDATVRKFMAVADECQLKSTQQPRQVATTTYERFRRFTFKYRCTASYAQFVRFVDALQSAGIPCAFESFKLVAQSKSILIVDAQIVFTTLN